jgi:hypothetical protein
VTANPKPILRDFDQVRSDLEQVVFRLKNASDEPKLRQKLLKQLRLLIEEADLIMAAEAR